MNSTGQIESKVLVEQVSKDHAATVAEILPKEGVVVVVQNGSASFSNYASALYACIPVGVEAGFIHQACSFRHGSR